MTGSVHLVVAPSCAEHPFVAGLVAALEVAEGRAGRPVTAVILPAGLLPSGDAVVLGEAGAESLIPIVLGHAASAEFPELSQLIVGDHTPAEVAQRVLSLVAAGGREVLELQGLVSSADHWATEGRRSELLLDPASVARSFGLLPVARRLGIVEGPLVEDFVEASRRHQRDRQRRVVGALATLSTLLVGLTVLALASRFDAVAASQVAREQEGISTSSRLIRQVDEMLTGAPDPDLPHLLTAQALRASSDPAAIDMARRVLGRVPPHTSVRLPGLPAEVAASENAEIAVTVLQDGRVVVLDGAAVVRVHEPVTTDHLPVPVVGPDGSRIALVGEDAVWFLEPLGNAEPARTELPGGVKAVAGVWLDSTFVTLTDHGPFHVRVGADAAPWGQVPWRDEVSAIDMSPDGRLLALASPRHGVWVGDPISGDRMWTSDARDVRDMLISGINSLVLLRADAPNQRVSLPDGTVREEPGHPTATALVRGPGGTLVTLGADGSVCHLDQEGGTESLCHPSHAGSVSGLAVRSGQSATIGSDGYLRVWPTPDAPRNLTEGATVKDSDPAARARADDPLTRNRLVVAPDGGGALFLPVLGRAVTFDATTLAVRNRTYYASWLGQYAAALSPDGHSLAVVWDSSVFVVDLDKSAVRWRTPARVPLNAGMTRSPGVAVTAGGSRVGYSHVGWAMIAGPSGAMDLTGMGGANQLALRISGDGTLDVVAADGTVHLGGRRTQVVRPPTTLVAAGFDAGGHPVVVDSNDVLATFGGGVRVEVATLPPGLEAHSVRVAPDGSRIAVLGRRQWIVVDAASGDLLGQGHATDRADSVHDAGFLADGALLVVRGDGAVQRHQLRTAAEVRETLLGSEPRELSPSERTLFSVG